MDKLTARDFAKLFGTSEVAIRRVAGDLIDAIDLRYMTLDGVARDDLILASLKRIHSSELKNAGEHRLTDWEEGWRENLIEFVQSNYDPRKLVPKYVKQNVPIKLNREYILPAQPDFVYQYTKIFRAWLFQEFLANCELVYEFGCGTGHNLFHLAELYPDKKLHGYDWAASSQEIIQIINEQFDLDISMGMFDFFNPTAELTFEPGSAVLTFGALEQVGPNHERYIDFLLRRHPIICVDVIGIHELYDVAYLLDYISLQYHGKRNYLSGYLTRLRELEAAGKIEIVKLHHHLFGNPYDDPYSYIVWKPISI
jgi:SAM-dependent methyltransferase